MSDLQFFRNRSRVYFLVKIDFEYLKISFGESWISRLDGGSRKKRTFTVGFFIVICFRDDRILCKLILTVFLVMSYNLCSLLLCGRRIWCQFLKDVLNKEVENFFFDKLVNEAVFLNKVEACCQKTVFSFEQRFSSTVT